MKSIIFEKNTLSWIVIILITIVLLFFQDKWDWISKYPKELIVPVSDWINFSMEKFIDKFGWFFLNISWLLSWPIIGAQWLLHSVPWVVVIFLVTFIAYLSSGLKLALFTLSASFYMVLIGYWEESMNTLALVIISVPMAIIIGFGLGIWGFYSKRAEKIIMPILDIFQTVPTFAYLLPILLLFGFGTVVGLIASILYSFPPMVRNTILGLKRVPDHIIESAIMSGANSKQLFWQAMLPSCELGSEPIPPPFLDSSAIWIHSSSSMAGNPGWVSYTGLHLLSSSEDDGRWVTSWPSSSYEVHIFNSSSPPRTSSLVTTSPV